MNRDLCFKCGCSLEERREYEGECPFRCPELHCPWWDKPRELKFKDKPEEEPEDE